MTDPANNPAPKAGIPARLHTSPLSAGMVVPFVTLAHTDRTRPIWGKLDPARVQKAFKDRLCQICGDPLGDPFVVYIRPYDFRTGVAVEAGLHPDCGQYSTAVCPMLAGAMDRHNPNPLTEFRRCNDPACTCALWRAAERDAGDPVREGTPAEAWYEASISLADYKIVTNPSDQHDAPAVGISLRPPTRIGRLRKIRDAAPDPDSERHIDPLAMTMAVREFFGLGEHH
ncbi:hypothetical protein [Nocardia sp. NPDC050435]|uniref:hypothetical protein n=1 Tax=Nocardia sp. NPDC050435 TaxID=3155040 RepID=UPI0033E44754